MLQLEDDAAGQEFHFRQGVWYHRLVESIWPLQLPARRINKIGVTMVLELPTPSVLGNGQSDAAVHLLNDDLTDDGMCGSVFLSDSCRLSYYTSRLSLS